MGAVLPIQVKGSIGVVPLRFAISKRAAPPWNTDDTGETDGHCSNPARIRQFCVIRVPFSWLKKAQAYFGGRIFAFCIFRKMQMLK
jgi:hypothetical protein